MNPPRPLLVATLPGRNARQNRDEMAIARDAGADIAEVRFDRWAEADRASAPQLFPGPLPLLATLRSRAEGGEGPDDPAERGPLLESFARLPFHWIDLEMERDDALRERLPPPSVLGRVLSAHLSEGTPAPEVARRLRGSSGDRAIRKVVVPATVGVLLREILPAIPPPGDGPRVLHTTGPSGPLLRAWSRRLEFPLVYAALPAAAPGRPSTPVEPSQIPVDRLRFYLDAEAGAPLFGVTGNPVGHSRSPALHSRWMRASGRPGLYVAFDTSSESEFVESLGALAAGGFRGLNVTHPWKAVALASASRVARGAEICGVASCLTFRNDSIEAENTDLVAILRRLEEYRRDGSWDGRELLVLGAGGAAAATLAAAQELGASASLLARDPARAATVADRFGATLLARADARPFSLLVHATPAGRSGAGTLEAPLPELIGPETRVLDWVYAAEDPILRDAAANHGAGYEDGWRLLVYQAAASFGVWWGEEPGSEAIDASVAEGPCTA